VQVIHHCLEKDPMHRFQSVAELAQALAPFAGERGRSAARSIYNMMFAGGSTAVPGGQPGPTAEGLKMFMTPPQVGHVTTHAHAAGHLATSPETPQAKAVSNVKQGKGKLLAIGGVLVLAVIVVIGVVAGGSGGGENDNAAASGDVVEEAIDAGAVAALPPDAAPVAVVTPDAAPVAVAQPPDAAPVAVVAPKPPDHKKTRRNKRIKKTGTKKSDDDVFGTMN
jgi:serine/threonine-protein kinase